MKASKRTKSALITSIISLVLCFTMLLGTTYAWFTDTASTGVNKIQAGTLDVQLLMYDKDADAYVDISDNTQSIFKIGTSATNSNTTLWEPGKTQVAYLAIKNNGSLALKYRVALDVADAGKEMYKVMQYAITPDAKDGTGVTSWTNGSGVVLGQQIVTDNVTMAPGVTHYFALSVHMMETAGNEYKNGEVDFDLTVYATQQTAESDSFNDQYDLNAQYPVEVNAPIVIHEGVVQGATLAAAEKVGSTDTPVAAVTIPNGVTVKNDATQLTFKANLTSTPGNFEIADGAETKTFDVKVEGLDNENNATPVTVELYVGSGRGAVTLLHNGRPIACTYNDTTGFVTFQTAKFSLFTVVSFPGGVNVSTDAELAAALDSTTTVIVVTDDVTFDWGNNSYANSNALKLQNKIIRGATGSETITFKGYGSANPIKNATFCNITIADQTVGDVEGAWEHGYLEFENLTAENVNFKDQPQFNGTCKLTGCTFNGTEGQYAAWVNSGNITFVNCTFNGGRSLKLHEAYGSDVKKVTVDGCTFKTAKKPGVVIGTLDSTTVVTIQNSTFDHCPAGDQGKYIYESDTDVATFTLTLANNTVING